MAVSYPTRADVKRHGNLLGSARSVNARVKPLVTRERRFKIILVRRDRTRSGASNGPWGGWSRGKRAEQAGQAPR